MIQGYSTHLRKSCNVFLGLTVLIFLSSAYAALDSKQELTIAYALLTKFSQKCSHIDNSDTQRLKTIKENLEKSVSEKHFEAQRCMESEISQIEGTRIVFRNLCANVTNLGREMPVSELERLLVDTSRYDNGIRPYVQRMNDCLRVADHGDNYMVDIAGIKLQNRRIIERLDFRNVKMKFRPNRTDFR